MLSLLVFWLGSFVMGVYYLVVANNWNAKYDGVLYDAHVYIENDCDRGVCWRTYYVEQDFYKGTNTTSSCSIRRLTPLSSKKVAKEFIKNMKLGTTRTIYQTIYNHDTCFDDKVKETWNVMGGISISIFLLPLLIVFTFCILNKFKIGQREPTRISNFEMVSP